VPRTARLTLRWYPFPLLGEEVFFDVCFGRPRLASTQSDDPTACFAKLRIASLVPVFSQGFPYLFQCEPCTVRCNQFNCESPQQPRAQMRCGSKTDEFHDDGLQFRSALLYWRVHFNTTLPEKRKQCKSRSDIDRAYPIPCETQTVGVEREGLCADNNLV
jgi:hypothetical protein